MNCRECGKPAVGMVKNSVLGKPGMFSLGHFWEVYIGLCDECLKKEEERYKNL